MDKFVSSLKKKYIERLLHSEDQWPPVSVDKLVNLELVEVEKKLGFRAGIAQHSAHSKSKRTPILHSDLFTVEVNKKPVRKIIIEGNAGIGKTTLCTLLTEEWANGKILKQFDCVLLLPLREKSVSTATSFPQILQLFHSSERICKSVIEELEEREGEGILIIADGWDELNLANRCKDSFLYNLLFGTYFTFACVLLSSRPSASASLHNLTAIDHFVEVVGFSKENIKQYIESEFEETPEKGVTLLEQLRKHPIVESLCFSPLNCAIICHLWHTLYLEQSFLPNTLTELYIKLILNIIFRNIKKNFSTLCCLENFDSIPSELQTSFWLVCQFAFNCLVRDQLVFSEKELSTFSELMVSGDSFLHFGLLQSAHSLLPTGYGISFHFVHLTVQEFLAALYFASQKLKEKMRIFREEARSSRLYMVWRFGFGLICDNVKCSEKIVNLSDSEQLLLMRFFCKVNQSEFDYFSYWERKYYEKECKELHLLLCHCAFESKNSAICEKIANDIFKGVFDFLRAPEDCTAAFHILTYTSNLYEIELDLNACDLGTNLLVSFPKIFQRPGRILQVERLVLDKNSLSIKDVNDLIIKNSTSLRSLKSLSCSHLQFNGAIPSCLQVPGSLSCLACLDLSDNPLHVSGIQSLETAIYNKALTHLQDIQLANTLPDDADINGALLATLLPVIVTHCSSFKFCDLSRNNLGIPGICSLGESMVSFASCILSGFFMQLDETGVNRLAISLFMDIIRRLQGKATFGLSLCQNQIGYEILLAFIYSDLSIEILDMSNTSFDTSEDLEPENNNLELPRVTPENNNLTDITLDGNNLSGDNFNAVIQCLQFCCSLKDLSTESCNINTSDIFKLNFQQDLLCALNLEFWNLNNNCLDGAGIKHLIDCIKKGMFPKLGKIELEDNIPRYKSEGALADLDAALQVRYMLIMHVGHITSLKPNCFYCICGS